MENTEEQEIGVQPASAAEPEHVQAASVSGKKAEKKPSRVMSRRAVMASAAGTVALLAVGGLRLVGEDTPLRPPGGQDETNLLAKCIRCGRCMESCPQQIIVPTHVEDGIVGVRTPTLNFDEKACTFCEDTDTGRPYCAAACPTGALDLTGKALPFVGNSKESIHNLVLGKAQIDEYQCLAYRDTGCHFCFDACPYDAIELDESIGGQALYRPVVKTDMCNGCGTCESVCVSLTAGSIVDGATERAIKVKPYRNA